MTHKWTESSSTTPAQKGFGRNVNEEVLHIPQISRFGALPSDGLVSYTEHLLGETYPCVEMQPAYSAASTDWAE